MAVDFYLADSLKEASKSKEWLHFNEKVQVYLLKQYAVVYPQSIMLTGLDPYGDRLFNRDEVLEIITICERINNNENNIEVKEFCTRMIAFCNLALQKNKSIFAAGD